MSDGPSKTDIQQVFKRLRSAAANKVCFDCGSKNPTWASITYGIFICIDCSGIHRSLGVHLTFIRSTNLDTNWTWQQLRQMQLGGNAKATSFFRSQNCNTTDTQVKYKSRAAQLYREKLHSAAAQAMRLHGTKLFIESSQDPQEEEKAPAEEDFFSKHENDGFGSSAGQIQAQENIQSKPTNTNGTKKPVIDDGLAPNVDLSLDSVSADQKPAPRKSTLLNKKAPAKKGGLGAKKGLGAQKATKNFAEIEKEAELADQIAQTRIETTKIQSAKSAEEEAKAMANMKLAYQDLSIQQKKETEKMKKLDPAKAAQAERLGMGFGGFGAGPKSHSLMSETTEIVQEEPSGGYARSSSNAQVKDKFFDDFEIVDADDEHSTPAWRNSRVDEICEPVGFSSSSKPAWENDLNFNVKMNNNSANTNRWDNDFDNGMTEKKKPMSNSSSFSGKNYSNNYSSSSAGGEDAVKKFGNAKSISSDMYFGNEGQGDRDANLTRFQGSSAISSDMYFNRDGPGQGSGGMSRSASYNVQTPDLEDVKESVKQGVSKVAGRLSNMASGVMNQIQDRYGY